MDTNMPIVVVGAGAWGTALAIHLSRGRSGVSLLCRRAEQAHSLTCDGENATYLPGVPLPSTLSVTADPTILENARLILWVVPCQKTQAMAQALKPHIPAHVPLVLCSKGILFDASSGESTFPTQVLASVLPNPVALLSGPNFAAEVAKGLPTATTLACANAELARSLGEALRSPHLRVYLTQDVTGVQIAGALKNTLAIACGLAHGLGLGENAKAALITRGLAEIRRLGIALGGQLETFLGLAGVGDLVLTCSSTQSRNFRFGAALGQAQPIEKAMENVGGVVEGFYTTQAAYHLAAQNHVHMPITQCLCRILYDKAPLPSAIEGLMQQLSAWESD